MQKFVDESHDRSYFVLTPRMVLYRCANVYDFTLWTVIKDIAGESGECYLSTVDLAKLAMMSTGQAQKSRKRLMDLGLLAGELKRDPGYPQPVWHLAIPDIWAENMRFCKNDIAGITDRLKLRALQDGGLDLEKEHSPGERSEEHSPGEKGGLHSEKGGSPSELKKIHKEDPEEEPIGADSPLVKNRGAFLALAAFEKNKGDLDWSDFPEDVRNVVKEFCSLWRLDPPAKTGRGRRAGSEFVMWVKEAEGLRQACGEFGLDALREAHRQWSARRIDDRIYVVRPRSVTGLTRAAAASLRQKKGRQDEFNPTIFEDLYGVKP